MALSSKNNETTNKTYLEKQQTIQKTLNFKAHVFKYK